jgi:hypothetical protein
MPFAVRRRTCYDTKRGAEKSAIPEQRIHCNRARVLPQAGHAMDGFLKFSAAPA